MGKSELSSRELAADCFKNDPPEYWPLEWAPTVWSHETGKILSGRYDCKSNQTWVGGHRFETLRQLAVSPSKFIFPLENFGHKINSCARCNA